MFCEKMQMESPRVLIIVVNYRTPALTLLCAESLRETFAQFPNAQLVIVDNGSGDDSLAQLRASETLKELRAQILSLSENGGFAVGNNAVLHPALGTNPRPDFVWLLNSDTQVRGNALAPLVAAMQANPRMGIAGSRLENADETPQSSAFRFPGIVGEWEANVHWRVMTRLCARWVIAPPSPMVATRTDWVPGASMLIRRAVLEQIGLLDEHFFMYYEDVDFCHRAHSAGWETWYIPTGRVEHRVSASRSTGSTPHNAQRMPRYMFDARRYYFLKHHGRIYTFCANVMWLCGLGLWRVRQFLQRKTETEPLRLWRDFFRYHFLSGETRA